MPYLANDNFKCSFVDESFFLTLDKKTPALFAISLNVQGLLSKFERLSSLISNLSKIFKPPHLIVLQETWLSKDKHPPCLPNYHPLVHCYRSLDKGDGVGIYVHEKISFNINQELSVFADRLFESIAIDINFHNKKFSVINLYLLPHLIQQIPKLMNYFCQI